MTLRDNSFTMTDSQSRLWRKPIFVLALIAGLIVLSACAFTMFHSRGVAVDCKPGQSDGQCGLGTSIGTLYGAIAAIVISIVGGSFVTIHVYLAVCAQRRRLAESAAPGIE